MVNIVVLGWYGTETIGDRAILAGLFKVFGQCFDSYHISIGSLFPFFTERTILEDQTYYYNISENHMISIDTFSCLEARTLRRYIKSSDFVIFGGGPITDISYIYAIEYGFKYARKNNKKTGIIGCGLGPLHATEYIECMYRLVEMSDVVVLRDEVSKSYLKSSVDQSNIIYSVDPAVFAADYFSSQDDFHKYDDYIVFNFRDFNVVDNDKQIDHITNFFVELLLRELENTTYSIRLIPMHTFIIGGDDRCYLNKIARIIDNPRVYVQNEPLSLVETMRVYKNAKYCYGMRFHSILLQTILNGRNTILDYTNKKQGKTIGLLEVLGIYNDLVSYNRYTSLSDDHIMLKTPNFDQQLEISKSLIDSHFQKYVTAINSCF